MTELYARHHLRAPAAGGELFAILAEAVPGLSRRKARLAVAAGLVTVDGAVESEPKAALPRAGAAVVLDLSQGLRGPRGGGGGSPAIPVLHRDDHVLVVDKPVGLLSAPDPAEPGRDVPALLQAACRRRHEALPFLGLVHRIDRETSGCLVFALSHQARTLLQAQFSRHGAGRTYRCLVAGGPREDEDVLVGRLGRGEDGRRALVPPEVPGKEAVTRFRVLTRFAHGAELEVSLETGRTHQIRVQLAAIGCPILGDPVYGPRGARARHRRGVARLMLHAVAVAFDHPADGARVTVAAPPPQAWLHHREILRRGGGGDGRVAG